MDKTEAIDVALGAVNDGAEYARDERAMIHPTAYVAGGWFRQVRNGKLGWQVGEEGSSCLFISDDAGTLGEETNRVLNRALALRELDGGHA